MTSPPRSASITAIGPLCAALAFGCAAAAPLPPSAPVVSLDASEILERSKATYGRCSTYEDEGVVYLEGKDAERQRVRKPFRTWFVRTEGFRYEYYDITQGAEWEPYVVWMTRGSTRIWWQAREAQFVRPTLDDALAGSSRSSGGSAGKIASLLYPEMRLAKAFWRLRDFELLRPEPVDGTPCDRIQATSRRGERVTLSIGQDDYLVRKIVEEAMKVLVAYGPAPSDEPSVVSTTTTYKPVCDAAIDPAIFRYQPPDPKTLVH